MVVVLYLKFKVSECIIFFFFFGVVVLLARRDLHLVIWPLSYRTKLSFSALLSEAGETGVRMLMTFVLE